MTSSPCAMVPRPCNSHDHQPDPLLLDLLMPELDGCAFYRAYRDAGGQASVILLTASSGASMATRLGVDDHLTKPFEVDVLLETIARRLPPRSS
jgi:two-component system response regulator QseB